MKARLFQLLQTSPIVIIASLAHMPSKLCAMEFSGDIPLFVEQAEQAGIQHQYTGPWEYFVGGGVAAFDCNGDRYPELLFAGGTNQAALYINHSSAGGSLTFAKQALIENEPGPLNVTGAYVLDIDNDGWQDLVLLRVGANMILRGEPDCKFTPANRQFGIDGGRDWTTAFAATFEPGQSFPTLAFGNYVDRTAPGSPWGTCASNTLLRPETSSRSDKPAYQSALLLDPGYCTLSLLFTDWNNSGRSALRVTNDRQYHRGGQEQLWRFDQGKLPRQYTSSDGWKRVVIWGMGIAEGDLDGDGYPEYALTSMGDTKLQKLDIDQFVEQGAPMYNDIAYTVGATAHRPYLTDSEETDLNPSTGWHSQFADVNNDARLDLFISKGNVEQMPDFAAYDPDNMLLRGFDGRFTETGKESGIALDTRGRGASVVDLNLDGMLDLVVVNRSANVSLFRQRGIQHSTHVGKTGNWLQIELKQPGTNRHAVGATMAIKTGNLNQSRTISVGGGHASGTQGFVHVGLGVAERARIRVRWPDGQWSAPYQVFANQFVVIEKGNPHPGLWYPARKPDGRAQY